MRVQRTIDLRQEIQYWGRQAHCFCVIQLSNSGLGIVLIRRNCTKAIVWIPNNWKHNQIFTDCWIHCHRMTMETLQDICLPSTNETMFKLDSYIFWATAFIFLKLKSICFHFLITLTVTYCLPYTINAPLMNLGLRPRLTEPGHQLIQLFPHQS